MTRPTYLANMDSVQDEIERIGMKGCSFADLEAATGLSYAQVQAATSALRQKGYILAERRNRRLRFFPKL